MINSRNIKIAFCLTIVFTIGKVALGQDKTNWNHDVGINLLQIPATTVDLTYEFSNNPKYTMVVNTGYTINYAKSFDFLSFLLVPHYKCGNLGYTLKKQSGGFIKVGAKYNFRKGIEKKNYFYLGAFFTSSLVNENATYDGWEDPSSRIDYLSHKVFIFGLTGAVGYNFKISNKLTSYIGVHISAPSKSFNDMYGYCNYIPGMGYMETCGDEWVFPMLVFNLKYKLK